jgi:hypothetical protein
MELKSIERAPIDLRDLSRIKSAAARSVTTRVLANAVGFEHLSSK